MLTLVNALIFIDYHITEILHNYRRHLVHLPISFGDHCLWFLPNREIKLPIRDTKITCYEAWHPMMILISQLIVLLCINVTVLWLHSMEGVATAMSRLLSYLYYDKNFQLLSLCCIVKVLVFRVELREVHHGQGTYQLPRLSRK